MVTRKVPEDWRKANITPIFKKGKVEIQGATSQLHHDPWEGDRTVNPGNHSQAFAGSEGDQG